MKHLVIFLVLSSFLLVSCSEFDTTEPVATLSGDTPSSLAKDKIKTKCPDDVKYEGKTYNTVIIGTQCWLKENLDVGTMSSGVTEQTNNGTIEKYCYDDDSVNCTTYGGLYQWIEAMQYSTTEGAQGICPKGWHIPTDTEFQTLSTTVGGDGNALKALGVGTDGGIGTNTSGFSALLPGWRHWGGYFTWQHSGTVLWGSTEADASNANTLVMYDYTSGIFIGGNLEPNGFSVRCLKD